jgi:hypothetical protein
MPGAKGRTGRAEFGLALNEKGEDARAGKEELPPGPLTGGGMVTVTQWKTSSANSDFSHPAPLPKAKAKRS